MMPLWTSAMRLVHSTCDWSLEFFFSSRRRHTRFDCDWSSDVCSSDLLSRRPAGARAARKRIWLFEEGNATMRDLLGGKGAGLAEMSRVGLPVPPGFTMRSEERRVGKECRSRWSPYH